MLQFATINNTNMAPMQTPEVGATVARYHFSRKPLMGLVKSRRPDSGVDLDTDPRDRKNEEVSRISLQ